VAASRHADRGAFLGRRRSFLRPLLQISSLLLYSLLLFYVAWPFAGSFSPDVLPRKEWVPVELHLWLDPLVGISAALAARSWNVALVGTAAALLLSFLVPRGFCSYLCPLGTLIDIADRSVSRWIKRPPALGVGKWGALRFGVLGGLLAAALGGVLLAGHVAAIPLLTRGLVLSVGRWQVGGLRGWDQIGVAGMPEHLSAGLLVGVLLLSLLGRRFWCRYLCPSGALLSCVGCMGAWRRRVSTDCTGCGKCLDACAFDAIRPEDYSTRRNACATCGACAASCPAGAIAFCLPFREEENEQTNRPGPKFGDWPVSRRALLLSVSGGLLAAWSVRGARSRRRLLRPPGAVSEERFLDLCVRCGECFKVCPGPVLHPAGVADGLEALWTPVAIPVRAGCHPDCNLCTQVCPTRAIRPLSHLEKRRTVMGVARVNRHTCLAFTGVEECRYCLEECAAAGYHAIEMRRIKLDIDLSGLPEGTFSDMELEEMSHIEAPFVNADACVGCGLCEYRCHAANVKQRGLLKESAIVTVAQDVLRRP